MRAILGLLILGTLFVMAASWQNRTTSRLKDRRAMRYATPTDTVETGEGWSQLILGRPSGAEPLALPEPAPAPMAAPAPAQGTPNGAAPQGSDPDAEPLNQGRPGTATLAPAYRPDFEYVVRENDSLGIICQKHYEERPLLPLVEAVALYNDLKSPDSIRSGDTILLPDADVLFPNR